MNSPSHDESAMQQALEQARLALCLSAPNPAVGCVLLAPSGQIIGTGHTMAVGGPHAEVMALRMAEKSGANTQGATAYVTLEPCAHTGRTPPCVDALIRAQVARVVVAVRDPNPVVAGLGITRLQEAGIRVELGLGSDQARLINAGFFSRMARRRPWLRLKVAASIDGFTALSDGQSQWITAEPARQDNHLWRARAGAIVSGIGTILADNAQLNVRLSDAQISQLYAGGAARQPLRVIVDSQLRIGLDARVLHPATHTWVATAQTMGEKFHALQALGVRVLSLPDAYGRVDLAALMQALAQEQVNEVHLEAGAHLNGAMLQAELVDELLIYLAPKIIGAGRGLWTLPGLASLERASAWQIQETQPIDKDLRLRLLHPRSLAFLDTL